METLTRNRLRYPSICAGNQPSGDSDGVRTRDLRRDRPAHQPTVLRSHKKLGFLIKDFHFVRDHYGGVYMFVGTLTQSTKSAKHSQFSLRAYKLFYQAINILPLTVMIANRLGNFAHDRSRFYQVLLTFCGAEGRIRTDAGRADGLQDRSNQPLWDFCIFGN